MRPTVDPGHGNHHESVGRRGLSPLARIGFILAAVAPALLWAEPAAARIAVNHNESVARDQRA